MQPHHSKKPQARNAGCDEYLVHRSDFFIFEHLWQHRTSSIHPLTSIVVLWPPIRFFQSSNRKKGDVDRFIIDCELVEIGSFTLNPTHTLRHLVTIVSDSSNTRSCTESLTSFTHKPIAFNRESHLDSTVWWYRQLKKACCSHAIVHN